MERFFTRFTEKLKPKDKILPVTITDEAKNHLRAMMLRPNPNLSEFIFFGLGKNDVIDSILVNDSNTYPKGPGLHRESNHVYTSSTNEDDLVSLLEKLNTTGRFGDLLVFGHTHPSGKIVIDGQIFYVAPSESNLVPSAGSIMDGGLTNKYDLLVAKEISKKWSGNSIPHFGIAADTQNGLKLRLYKTTDLAKVKRYSDIDRAAQVTLTL